MRENLPVNSIITMGRGKITTSLLLVVSCTPIERETLCESKNLFMFQKSELKICFKMQHSLETHNTMKFTHVGGREG